MHYNSWIPQHQSVQNCMNITNSLADCFYLLWFWKELWTLQTTKTRKYLGKKPISVMGIAVYTGKESFISYDKYIIYTNTEVTDETENKTFILWLCTMTVHNQCEWKHYHKGWLPFLTYLPSPSFSRTGSIQEIHKLFSRNKHFKPNFTVVKLAPHMP